MPPWLTVLALACAAPVPPPAAVPPAALALRTGQAIDPAGFQDAMRKLWEDHVTWTRLYIVSAVAGLPDVQPAAQRLLQNQADLGAAIKPFYGAAAGDRLTALLRSHILIAVDLVTAAKAGNSAAIQAAATRWDTNAVEIADFLSDANPAHWPRETMRAEMRHHLELTLREAQARLRSDWAGDIAAYDEIHQHILGLADVLSAGIIQQFPKQFSR
jgi:prophage DNA circulation protein